MLTPCHHLVLAASLLSLSEARPERWARQAAAWKTYVAWAAHPGSSGPPASEEAGQAWSAGHPTTWANGGGHAWSGGPPTTSAAPESSVEVVVYKTYDTTVNCSTTSTTTILSLTTTASLTDPATTTSVASSDPATTASLALVSSNSDFQLQAPATTTAIVETPHVALPSWSAATDPSSQTITPPTSSPPTSSAPTTPSTLSDAITYITSSDGAAWTEEPGVAWDTPVETVAPASTTATPAAASATTFPAGYTLDQCIAQADSVLPDWAGTTFNYSGVVRNYYVTSEQFSWNYVPSGWDNWEGVPIAQSARAFELGYLSGSGSLGGAGGLEWQKTHYVGYTDNTFTTQTEQPTWQGLNGPTLRAELGDMIQIIFLNKLAANYMTMHSMGLGYDETNKGALYINALGPGSTLTPQPGDAVPPGGCYTYKWIVGPTNAPGPGFTSRMWSYHPYVNMPNDLVTGLVGPVIIYSRGTMATTMAATREFILLYEGFPESQSWLDAANVATYQPSLLAGLTSAAAASAPPTPTDTGNSSIWAPQLANLPKLRLGPSQAPLFQTLNGFVFGNSPPYEMCEGDSATWYVYAFGAQSHTFHLHGNNFQVAGDPEGFFKAAQSLNNGEMMTLSMNGSRPGIWQAICHVNNHLPFGMVDYYQIYPAGACPLTPLTGPGNATIP